MREEGTIDVGYGLRPDLVGKGLGQEFVTAILDFGIRRYDPSQLRVLILDWNDRSRKVAERCGFTHRETIVSDERPFLVLTRRIR